VMVVKPCGAATSHPLVVRGLVERVALPDAFLAPGRDLGSSRRITFTMAAGLRSTRR
jgi:hypothetical protein